MSRAYCFFKRRRISIPEQNKTNIQTTLNQFLKDSRCVLVAQKLLRLEQAGCFKDLFSQMQSYLQRGSVPTWLAQTLITKRLRNKQPGRLAAPEGINWHLQK